MEIGKEESNVQNTQLSMQELYGKTQEPLHKKVLLTENMQYSDRERIHAYWLSRVDGIGAVTAAKLYESCGSFEEIYERVLYNRKKLDPFICSFLGKAVKKGLEEAVSLFKQRVEEYDRLEEQGVRFILCGEAAYPKRLMHIYDKPMWLFVVERFQKMQNHPRQSSGRAAVRHMDDRRQSISAGFWQKMACR